MLKKSLGIALLCIMGQAYSAEIVVTTTEDIVRDDKECSLREAVQYINQGMDKPYLGCGDDKPVPVIKLKEKEIYKLNSPLQIIRSMYIHTTYEKKMGDNLEDGLSNATIRIMDNLPANTLGGIFNIANSETVSEKNQTVSVRLREVTLEGCGAISCKVSKGGLIYNQGKLTLEYVKLHRGMANDGGAIYIAGINKTDQTKNGSLTVQNSLLENNTANEGGAIYNELPNFHIRQSVISKNTTTATSSRSSNIYTEDVLSNEETDVLVLPQSSIYSSTLYGNTGAAVTILDAIAINNTTIINNSIGVKFDVVNKPGYLANSIVLNNPGSTSANTDQNCQFSSEQVKMSSILQNNLVGNSCGTGASIYANEILDDAYTVLAGDQLEGKCPNITTSANAILCPYFKNEKQFLGYFRPRILMTYTNLNTTPILNKGEQNTDKTKAGCVGYDQRGKSPFGKCDRGAIEIQDSRDTSLVGQDLLIGKLNNQVARISIIEALGDSDLLPKEKCKEVVLDHPQGEEWQDGCLLIEQQAHVSSKGTVSLDLDGNLVYTPRNPKAGADLFTIRVVTTMNRFDSNAAYLPIRVNIVMEAENNMKSDKVKTSGGATSIFWLVLLMGGLTWRKLKK